MKVVILAGGNGTRMYQETKDKPKPMVEIGGLPLIWHIMKIYSWYGFNEFIVCLGYKKDYFYDYFKNSFTCIKKNNSADNKNDVTTYYSNLHNWTIHLADTGEQTMTGGRLKRISSLINEENFFLTYGDTLSNVNLNKLLKLHKKENALATLTTIQPRSQYGIITFDKNDNKKVSSFKEKPIVRNTWINGGFYALNKEIFKFIKSDHTIFENEPLEKLSKLKKLSAFKHKGFWQSVETYKDKLTMDNLWDEQLAEWNVWDVQLKDVL